MSNISFESYLEPEFIDLVRSLDKQGARIGIVGGTVRDYFLSRTNKHDYDCEIRFKDKKEDLLTAFLNLSLPKKMKIELLPYHIMKLSHPNFTCELSLPRKETFFDDEFGHKNFSVEFIQDEFYQESFLRRDFTFNAIMYEYSEYNEWKLIDPLGGLDDLNNKILRPCSESFVKDPVRFLRAIRFIILLNFKMDSLTIEYFSQYLNESGRNVFSQHYIHSEAKKSKRPIAFCLMVLRYMGNIKKNEDEKFLLKYELMTDSKIALHLKKYFYLRVESLSEAYDFFEIKIPNRFMALKSFENFDLLALSKLSFDEVKKSSDYRQVLIDIDALWNLNETYYKFAYVYLKLPFHYNDLLKLFKIDIDLTGIPNEDKNLFLLYKRLITWCEK